jgi:nucleoside-diphosphate-sugar epimerase/predicted dehydrogenase
MTKMTLLITGATGFIGSRLATLAMQRGHDVRTLTRSDWSSLPAVPVGHRFFGNFPNQIPAEALRGVEVVVHCAAVSEPRQRLARAVNVTGTIRLAQAARAAGVRTFVFLSSQSAKPDALAAYGRTKYEAEQALRELSGLDVVILRPGLVCGPGQRGLFQRMCRTVESLPVLPLLGGGRAIVQPIHVDDLCAAIFECAARSKELAGAVLRLGDPTGLSLAEFLQRIARARLGRPKPAVTIPLTPVEWAVGALEALRLPLPINSSNLKGMRLVEKMDTAADLARLGLSPRPIEAIVRDSASAAGPVQLDLDHRAVRMLLVGGGRIGMVHALTLSRLRGIDFRGVVDPKPAALGLLKGMGLKAPTFTALEQAGEADAAVIATPAATHLPLARACLSKGWGVLVEKPLAVRREQLQQFRQLAAEFPRPPFGVGYVVVQNPQVTAMLQRLRAGEFGRAQRFLGLTLHAYILQPDPKRWEVQKAISGGGVLINSGGHVLSMIQAAFGEPASIEVESRRIHSAEVEDSLIIRFRYPQLEGVQCASWSIPGFQRQENRLVVWTERGLLMLSASAALFLGHDGRAELAHQLDFDCGFNLAPDYGGAGFSVEHSELAAAVRGGRQPAVNLEQAIRIEQLLFDAYDVAKPVAQFSPVTDAPVPALPAAQPAPVKRLLDLRELSPATAGQFLSERPAAWDEYLVTTAHLANASAAARLRVTVPDFLRQSRLLMAGRYGDVVRQLGVAGALSAGFAALPVAAKARGVSFWAAAMGLLAGDLKRVPADFAGTLLLHGYLADLALALDQTELLEKMLRLCRRACPRARIGFHTNLAAEADNALPRLEVGVDEVSILTSPRGRQLDEIVRSLHQSAAVTAEVGPAPALVHQLAARRPQDWLHGADAVLLGPAAEQTLAAGLRAERVAAWAAAFAGTKLPEAAL